MASLRRGKKKVKKGDYVVLFMNRDENRTVFISNFKKLLNIEMDHGEESEEFIYHVLLKGTKGEIIRIYPGELSKQNKQNPQWTDLLFNHAPDFGRLCLSSNGENVAAWHLEAVTSTKRWFKYIVLRFDLIINDRDTNQRMVINDFKMWGANGIPGKVLVERINEQKRKSNGFIMGFPLDPEVKQYIYIYIY